MWTYCFDFTGTGLTEAQKKALPAPMGDYHHFGKASLYANYDYIILKEFIQWCSHYLLRETNKEHKCRVRIVYDDVTMTEGLQNMLNAVLTAYYAWIEEELWYPMSEMEEWDK